jgi:hypothetical protein
MGIFGVVIGGALIGLLGKVLASSKLMPLWLMIVCGVGGAVGGWLLFGLSAEGMAGMHWLRWIVAGGVAAAVVTNACLAFRGEDSG